MLQKMKKLSSEVAVPFCIPTSSIGTFQLLHILVRTQYCQALFCLPLTDMQQHVLCHLTGSLEVRKVSPLTFLSFEMALVILGPLHSYKF